jgi:hypothetical protein
MTNNVHPLVEGWYLGPTTPVIVWTYHGEDT